jgi:transcriptional antiterminator RfaH
VVRNGEEPCRLDAMFIAALRVREQDGVIVAPPVPYVAGQKVKITDGPFDGTVATIIDLAEKDRLVVLLEILNRPVNVKISARQVSPA